MDYIFEQVKENIYVLAIWDSVWNSYNNCYFIVKEDGVTLVDCGKREHSDFVIEALKNIGKTPKDVTLILATHGHEDHVQGAEFFTNAQKYIHPDEYHHIEYQNKTEFIFELTDQGVIEDFDTFLVGHHTPGSMAFYHRPSKVIFTGDFLCFFGDPLSIDGLVSEGKDLRHEWLKFLQNGGVPKDKLKSFLQGLRALNDVQAEVMCTGHGGVLTGNIREFVAELIEIGMQLHY